MSMTLADAVTPEPHVPHPTTIPPASGSRPRGQDYDATDSEMQATTDDRAAEEIDWLLAYGRFSDAERLLEAHLRESPDDPTLLWLRDELRTREANDVVASLGVDEDTDAEIDIEVVYEDELDADDRAALHEAEVEPLADGLRARVEAGDDDAESLHYALGVAFRLMGRFPEAIREFELAARDPAIAAVSWSMIGAISLDLERPDVAVEALLNAIDECDKTQEQEAGLAYELGHAYALLNRRAHALHYFQRAAALDPNRDDPRGSVAARIDATRAMPSLSSRPPAPPPVAAGDDFLDQLLASAVLP